MLVPRTLCKVVEASAFAHIRAHAQQEVHRVNFVVEQPCRHRWIAINPLFANLNPAVVIPLQESQTATAHVLHG